MSRAEALSKAEIEELGPPEPQELSDLDISINFLADLALKHVAYSTDPTTTTVAEEMKLPYSITEEVLQHLYREKFIEVKLRLAMGASRYGMLERGWDRVSHIQSISGYVGPAPVSLGDYTRLTRLQAVPARPATISDVRGAFRDLVLPETLLETIGYVVNSRRSLFITGPPGTGKTAVAERINAGLSGNIWIPYAIEIDGHIIRVFDSHNHRPAARNRTGDGHDRRWVCAERPLVIVGGELTLQDADLTWSAAARAYEAPFQMKSNGGTLVIDDFGRQRVSPQDLLNRWIIPLEKRIDYLTLQSGKKIEVPFEQLVVFSTNLDEKEIVDEAFLRRMGYRARVEPPTRAAYAEIFERAAQAAGASFELSSLCYLMEKYEAEQRPMKACEPRDLIERMRDICRFEGRDVQITPRLIDTAWRNYFGTSHEYAAAAAG